MTALNDTRLTQIRVRLRVPKHYRQQPVISRLVSEYHLTVNIAAALLDTQSTSDGWFDLELHGTHAHIQEGLAYLHELELEIWDDQETDGW
ncbi:MAG: NIL domain-containing protein [Leptolyngbyaceae cyanobacterium bins.59]|nr:NIL domain-containing protein [Leptolyngbyaceae cyanobacterium bins.59]